MMDAHIGRPVSERPLLVWVGEIRLVDGLDETLRQVLDVNELVQHAVPAHNYLLIIPWRIQQSEDRIATMMRRIECLCSYRAFPCSREIL
jgi:hypothetical protein